MQLSIVIPTFNRRDLLLQTLQSLEAQTLATSEFEVIVVVDGSTDGTEDALRGLNTPLSLKIIAQTNRGQAAARNAGAEHANTDTLLFLDDDIQCSQDLLSTHVWVRRDQPDAIVFGPVYLSPNSPRTVPAEAYRRYAEARFSRIAAHGPAMPQDAMLAPNSSISVALFRRSGGYDTDLARLEDIELGYRLWKLGTSFLYAADAVAYHGYDKTVETLIHNDAAKFGESDLKLCRLHREYRSHSAIRHFVQNRTLVARIAATLPFSIDPLLGSIYKLAVSLSFVSLATRLLQMRQGVAALRSAVTFSGGWAELVSEFQDDDNA